MDDVWGTSPAEPTGRKPWRHRWLLLPVLILWCWLPFQYLVPWQDRIAYHPSGWQFTNAWWTAVIAGLLGGLGVLVWRLQGQGKDSWLCVVAIASAWTVVMGALVWTALGTVLIGPTEFHHAMPAMVVMFACGLGLLFAGHRPVGWAVLLVTTLGAASMYPVGYDPLTGSRPAGTALLGVLAANCVVLGVLWQTIVHRRAPERWHWATIPLAAVMIAAASMQIAPSLARYCIAAPLVRDAYITPDHHQRLPITEAWSCCPQIIARRPRDPVAWFLYGYWCDGSGRRNEAIRSYANCWALAEPEQGCRMPDYAGVRLVEEGVYPAAVEQARRELGLD